MPLQEDFAQRVGVEEKDHETTGRYCQARLGGLSHENAGNRSNSVKFGKAGRACSLQRAVPSSRTATGPSVAAPANAGKE